jgi:hypothetical protein
VVRQCHLVVALRGDGYEIGGPGQEVDHARNLRSRRRREPLAGPVRRAYRGPP